MSLIQYCSDLLKNFFVGHIVRNDTMNLSIHEFVHFITFQGEKSNEISFSVFYKDLENLVEKEYGLKKKRI